MRYLIPIAMGITLFLIMFIQGSEFSTSLYGGIGALLGGGIVAFFIKDRKTNK